MIKMSGYRCESGGTGVKKRGKERKGKGGKEGETGNVSSS